MNLDIGIDDSKLLLLWGVTVTLAWAATAGMGMASLGVKPVMIVWTVLMALPLAATTLKYLKDDSNKLFNFWAIFTAFFMIENIAVQGSLAFYSYFHLWIAGGIIGFYYTGRKLPPPSDQTYRYGAIASLIGLAVAFYQPLAAPLVALIAQGTPLLYDWFTVYR
ncbi:MAG: hypothetical protein ABEK10_02740 [Candidatus Nanosalina sp.]